MNAHSNITPYIKNNHSNYGYWEMRDNAAVRALNAEDRQFVAAAVQRHNDRKRRGDWRPITKRTNFVAVLEEEVRQQVAPIVRKLYRTDVSGSTTIKIKLGKPHAIGYTSKNWDVYSKTTKFPGHDAHIEVAVMHGWRRHVASVEGLATAGGMLTTHAKQIGDGIWEATWITQGRGVDLNVQQGYIVGAGEEWAHAKTITAAQRMLKQRQAAAAAKQAAITMYALTNDEIVARFGHVAVTVADSRNAGNCPSGTASFVEMFFPGRKTATVAELFAVGKMQSYVRRAALAAIARKTK